MSTLLLRVFFRWLPLAALATACSLLAYYAVQQMYRQLANDPQLQLARDISSRLDAGIEPHDLLPAAAIDPTTSPSPFVMILDEHGAPVAASSEFRGTPRTIPAGVVDATRISGEDRITWQPAPGVRLATVVVRRDGARGFVLAARSLQESESRSAKWGLLVFLTWLATLAVLLVVVAVSEFGLTQLSPHPGR